MKQRRKELGINADQLADVLGIGISSLSRIERGKKAATVDVWEAATAYFDSYLQRPNEPLVSTSA
jgi:transcriptional regulator with XRE-family HTH domain